MPRRAAVSEEEKFAVVSISSSSDQGAIESDSDDLEEAEEDDDEYVADDDSDDEDYVCDEYHDREEKEEGGQSEAAEDFSSSNEDDGEDAVGGEPTDEECYKKVIDLLKRKQSLDILKLEECKSYLRKNGLRLSGTKATCMKRILEHCRLKDGNGEKLYPQSSFSINCTGDVCKGDVVLFRQRVFDKFDKAKRNANIIGKRTIAGRVLKESYGAAKQQHTFTVEVLWSKGKKALPPLFPLLVKGRNLYRLKTFRQRWSNELERSKVLAEKHQRGAAARHVRKISKAMPRKGDSGCQKSSSEAKQHFNKRRMEEPKHLYGRKRQKIDCATAACHPHANTQAAMTRNVNPRQVPCANVPFNAHSNWRGTATRDFNPSYAGPRQAIYHESRISPQYLNPWRNPFYDHHNERIELQPSIARPQTKSRNFHAPTHEADYSLGTTGLPNHALNMGHPHHYPCAAPQTKRRNFHAPTHEADYSLGMTGLPNHALNMGHPHHYPCAAPRFDPRITSQLWRQPDYDNGPTLTPGNRFWKRY